MALSAGRVKTSHFLPGPRSAPQKGSTTIFQNGMVMLDANGYARPAVSNVPGIAVGRAKSNGGTDRWAAGAVDGASSVDYEEGIFGWENSSAGDQITNAHIGLPCYVVDDETVALTDNSGARLVVAGRIAKVEGSIVFVDMSASIARQIDKARVFVSAEQTGTGSAQNVAHTLGAAPSKVVVVPTDTAPATAGQYTATQGSHTSANLIVTVTTGKKFVLVAYP